MTYYVFISSLETPAEGVSFQDDILLKKKVNSYLKDPVRSYTSTTG